MSAERPPRHGSQRIPLVGSEGLTPDQQRVYETVVSGPRGAVVGPLRAALHSPELADRWQRLGEQLRFNTALTARQSELAIITVARYWNSNTEWAIHAEIARSAGLAPSVIEAIARARPPLFEDPDEALIYEFTRQLLAQGQVSDEAYGDLYARFDEVRMVELTALVGYYTMVAMTLNAHGIPRPPGPASDLPQLNAAGATADVTRLPPAASLPLRDVAIGR